MSMIVKENGGVEISKLEAGQELPFAHLEPRGESLRIK